MNEKLSLSSENVIQNRINELKKIFPEVVSEGEVDIEKLKQFLGIENTTLKEKYEFTWAGKSNAIKIIQTPSIGTLIPSIEESINFDSTHNLFIDGDNLEVLKLLQKSYYGKIKMIYIDPPYNTANDFIYPDNYREGLQDYLRYTGQINDEGNVISSNTETKGRFHSKWLNMMYPRLFLARNLLKEDGVIFVSISNIEVSNLKLLMNEIFGEENFVECIIWRKKSGGGQQDKYFVTEHEYILCYAKNINHFNLIEKKAAKKTSGYNYFDEKKQKKYKRVKLAKWGSEALKEDRPTMYFPLTNPDGGKTYPIAPDGRDGRWRYGRARVNELLKNDDIDWEKDKDGNWIPYEKEYEPDENDMTVLKERSIFYDIAENTDGANELTELFGVKDVFPNPKPSDLIKHLALLVMEPHKEEILLDFFAGSGTSAQAILELNKIDNGNRKFICIQIPEKLPEGSTAKSLGYNTIDEVAKDRIRKVIEKLKLENDNNSDVLLDQGFKVFKLTSSNFKIWDGEKASQNPDELAEQLRLFVNNIQEGRTKTDILYEIMLKSGFMLTDKVEKIDQNKELYSIKDGDLIVCLEDFIDKDLITKIIELHPKQFICLDSAFHNQDQLKTNTVLEFKEAEITFKTV
ncbi:site-specific DNA-methyltransferase [Parageobacillus thermoglucosidasius]|uniref:site-specific DNA-methyltransferase n=1 Tax=Parageobacillus thermoglucosidasius TaxID=1426 RepID=UPI003D270BBA